MILLIDKSLSLLIKAVTTNKIRNGSMSFRMDSGTVKILRELCKVSSNKFENLSEMEVFWKNVNYQKCLRVIGKK